MKKEELRIVFMGTPDFAVPSLKAIIENGYNVVGVITAPDRKSGRGRKVNASAVKKFAIENNLNIMQPTNLKDDTFIDQLSELKPNLQIVVAFRMLPKSVWSIPEYGTFNLHASLLPNYRGAAPINYALINGEKVTGVTTFLLDEEIDTGKILLQKKVPIEDTDDAGSLHDKLMQLGSNLVIDTIEGIRNNSIEPLDQNTIKVNDHSKEAPKISKEDCRIQWKENSETIFNFIRGLSPYPGAHTFLVSKEHNISVKIFSVHLKEGQNSNKPPGNIEIINNEMLVYTLDGLLSVISLQLEGKKRMSVKEMLNGFNNIESYHYE